MLIITENYCETISFEPIKKTDKSLTKKINHKAKHIAEKSQLGNRIECLDEKNSYITLKDHKDNFYNNPQCRQINPTKSEIGYEDEGGQVEMVWTCHEERPRVCWKKDDGNGVTGKEKKREIKEKIFRYSEKNMGEVGAKETDVEHKTVWRKMIRCGYP